jgi:hypothetical protein
VISSPHKGRLRGHEVRNYTVQVKKKLVLCDLVGVPSSCCTINSGHIGLWTKMRRSGGQFSGPEPSSKSDPSDFITTTSESKFSVHTDIEGFFAEFEQWCRLQLKQLKLSLQPSHPDGRHLLTYQQPWLRRPKACFRRSIVSRLRIRWAEVCILRLTRSRAASRQYGIPRPSLGPAS